jgi:hypothetical protein
MFPLKDLKLRTFYSLIKAIKNQHMGCADPLAPPVM